MKPNTETQWGSTEEFLAARLHTTEAEMATAILNRTRWDRLRDERRLLVFLRTRTQAADFESVRAELNRINQGYVRVPELDSPRRKAADCLSLWASDLAELDELPLGVRPKDAAPARQVRRDKRL